VNLGSGRLFEDFDNLIVNRWRDELQLNIDQSATIDLVLSVPLPRALGVSVGGNARNLILKQF